MSKLPISLVIITKNEAQNLRRCIESAPFVSEIVVLDTQSTDGTDKIAESLGARVYQEEWKGFGKQKQSAADKAAFDWVLSLDADEAVSAELAKEIQEIFLSSSNGKDLSEDAYKIPRLSFHMGRWIRHGGWYPDYQIRLFHRKRAKWSEAELHEKIQAQKIGTLKHSLEHFVFRDLFHQIEANNKYSTLGAQEWVQKGKRFSLLALLLKPCSKFLETYIWKLGFLDGLPGFVIAVGAAYSMFLRHAKVWESQKKAQWLKNHQ